MADTLIIPPINSKGMFTFKAPYNTLLNSNKEYTVKAVRSLKEMADSGERPYENIYKETGLTETDYYNALNSDIPIIVMIDSANNYAYVPADKITSLPLTSGVKYQQTTLAVNLGLLPLSYVLDNIQKLLVDTIKANTGITTTVVPFVTSAVHLVTKEKDEEFKKQLEASRTNKDNYATKYISLEKEYKKTKTRLKLLEDYIKENLPPIPSRR